MWFVVGVLSSLSKVGSALKSYRKAEADVSIVEGGVVLLSS